MQRFLFVWGALAKGNKKGRNKAHWHQTATNNDDDDDNEGHGDDSLYDTHAFFK